MTDEKLKKSVFHFLDELRESGACNMFGASAYVIQAFSISKEEARALTTEWMRNFGK